MPIFIVFSSSELGGAERSLTRMALASPPGDFQLATLDGEGVWCDWVRSQGHKPLVFGERNKSQHGKIRLSAFVSLVSYLRNEDIQTVYICGTRAAFWLRLFRPFVPQAKLVQGIRWNPDSNSSLDRFFRFIERRMNGQIDMYITNSQIAATTLVKRCGIPKKKVRVIYNGLAKMPTKILPLGRRPLNVLTVANFNPRKGYLEYLSAIEKVLQNIPDVNFTFIGRDDMNGKVQSAIRKKSLSKHVKCVGFQENISSWMKVARLLVVPSLWGEGCPTSVLEAMSHGVPVAGYNLDGLPELVRHKQDGLLVPAANTKLLAIAIIQLLTKTEVANKMSASSLLRIKQEFQLNSCVLKHRDILNRLI